MTKKNYAATTHATALAITHSFASLSLFPPFIQKFIYDFYFK